MKDKLKLIKLIVKKKRVLIPLTVALAAYIYKLNGHEIDQQQLEHFLNLIADLF
jgi:hypothetical protein